MLCSLFSSQRRYQRRYRLPADVQAWRQSRRERCRQARLTFDWCRSGAGTRPEERHVTTQVLMIVYSLQSVQHCANGMVERLQSISIRLDGPMINWHTERHVRCVLTTDCEQEVAERLSRRYRRIELEPIKRFRQVQHPPVASNKPEVDAF